jgi:hypothetical protein
MDLHTQTADWTHDWKKGSVDGLEQVDSHQSGMPDCENSWQWFGVLVIWRCLIYYYSCEAPSDMKNLMSLWPPIMIQALSVTNLMHKFLYSYNVTLLYMFRALLYSSSGGEIVCTQHLVSSLLESGDTRCCVHTIWPPEEEYNSSPSVEH